MKKLILGFAIIILTSFCPPVEKIYIYHYTNNKGWKIIEINKNTINHHSSHGDLYLSTLCPLSGEENACR